MEKHLTLCIVVLKTVTDFCLFKECIRSETWPDLLQVKDDGTSVKEWILRYAEQKLEESSEEEERNGDGAHTPETDKKFDPVSQNTFHLSP